MDSSKTLDWLNSIDAWLFDLDGTLVDSTACVIAAWQNWCPRHGLNADDVIHKAHGRRALDSVKLLLPHANHDEEVAILEDLECNLTDGLVVIDGAHTLLSRISSRPWAIVTSGSIRVASHRTNYTRLPLPPVLVCADDVVHGKPDPEGYLLAAKRLNVPPSKCVVVEDAVAGIRAGKTAGMRVIAVATTHAPHELMEADYVCESLSELLDNLIETH
ncbi:MAG TPA: HAD-IA family hydrolase [Drouetiella sp.]|jgi:mannitol-1-/sugar-/sorbitol-6-phosphatase